MRIEDLPKEDRPREKAIEKGIGTLSNSELIALILGSGYKGMNAIELSQFILGRFNGLSSLMSSPFESLDIKGLSEAKKLRLLACSEISKRLNRPSLSTNKSELNPMSIVDYFSSLDLSIEQVILLVYSRIGKLKLKKILYSGTSSSVSISPTEIIKEVNKVNGYSFTLIHNHPSGIAKPSKSDIVATLKLRELSKNLEVKFNDHLIIGKDSYYSFAENIT